ncbi:hypothetical protein M758_10G156100 [Ceratodon purpureus]|nr:hypothetical protein M758_10G156100 [Ceratodon purpureus]
MAPSVIDCDMEREQVQKRRFSSEEVALHRGLDDAWVVVDGEVYDVTEFLQSHPGGPEVILEHLLEKDLGQPMRGASNNSDHAHSEAAFDLLKEYHIGSLNDMPCSADSRVMHQAKRVDDKAKTYTVDLSKPLVFQVGHLGDCYQEWVHQPIVQKESPRFFGNDFLESLTKTIWWVVPVIWIPVVCWCQVIAIRRGFPVDKLLTTLPLGIFIWSLVEYTLHRFLFHVKTKSYWANTLHYLLHGCHHKHPMDGYRLVFPPTFAALFAVPLYGVIALLFSRIWAPSVFGFGLLGYVLYDVTHYFLHHGTPVNDATRNLKRYHLNHHFKMQEDSYGITSPIWDFIFGTLPAKLKYDSNVLQ